MKTEKKEKKNKNKKRSPHRIRRGVYWGCWTVAAASLAFGIYKNFTATDRIIEKETETVVHEVENYVGLESFTKNFAEDYFTYSTESEEQAARKEALKQYMQPSLLDVNSGNTYAESDILVQGVQVWEVEELPEREDEFEVLFTVKMKGEEETVQNAYTVDVYCKDQQYVIVKNPTMTSLPVLADYEKEPLQQSAQVSAEDRERVETFLETFFGVYPGASEKELAYYVKDQDVHEINKDYALKSIDRVVIEEQEKGFYVECYVSYIDQTLGVQVLNQFELDLGTQEDGKLIIENMR